MTVAGTASVTKPAMVGLQRLRETIAAGVHTQTPLSKSNDATSMRMPMVILRPVVVDSIAMTVTPILTRGQMIHRAMD